METFSETIEDVILTTVVIFIILISIMGVSSGLFCYFYNGLWISPSMWLGLKLWVVMILVSLLFIVLGCLTNNHSKGK